MTDNPERMPLQCKARLRAQQALRMSKDNGRAGSASLSPDLRQAREEALLAQARAVAQLARLATQRGDPMSAMFALLEVLPDPDRGDDRPESAAALAALLEAYLANRELRAFDRGRTVLDMEFTAAGPLAVLGAGDGELEVWNLAEPDAPRWRIALADRAELGGGAVGSVGRHLAYDAKDGMLDLTLCADGKALAIAGYNLVVCRIGDGEPSFAALSAGSKGKLTRPMFSPDGRHLVASNGYDGKSRLWRLDGAEPRLFLLEAAGAEHRDAIDFSTDGRRLAGRTHWGGAVVWDLTQDEPVPTVLKGPSRDARVAAFSADGRWVASGDTDGTTLIWSIAQPSKPFATLKGHRDRITAVAFSADGHMVATADRSGSVQLSIRGAAGFESVTTGSHDGPVHSLAFRPDGSRFASAGEDGTVRLWSTIRGSPDDVLLRGDGRPMVSVAFSPSGRSVLGRGRSAVRVWHGRCEPAACTAFSANAAPIYDVACDPHGRHLGTADESGRVRIWALDQSPPRLAHEGPAGGHPRALRFSPDGRWVALRDNAGVLQLSEIGGAGVRNGPPRPEFTELRDAAFSPDSRHLAVCDARGNARLLELASGAITTLPRAPTLAEGMKLRHAEASVHRGSVAFSPDGSLLAISGRYQGIVELWRLDAERLGVIVLDGPANFAAFSADGRYLACSEERATRIWRLANSCPVRWAELVHGSARGPAVFSENGSFLFPDSYDGPSVWWLDGDQPRRLPLHDRYASNLFMSPDARLLLAAGSRVLWQVESDGFLPVALPFEPSIWAAAFSADSRTLATGHQDGSVRLWPVPLPADLIRLARAAATRALTRAERGDLGIDDQRLPPPDRRRLSMPREGEAAAHPVACGPPLVDDWSAGPAVPVSTNLTPDQQQAQWTPERLRDQFGFVMYEATSADGRWYAVGTDDSDIWLLDIAANPPQPFILRIDGSVGDVAVLSRLGRPLSAPVTSVSPVIQEVEFSPDGTLLLSGSFDAGIWLLAGPVPRLIDFGDVDPPMFRAFTSPDGRRLVAGREGGGQALHDLTTHPPTPRRLPGSSGLMDTAWFSPDGSWLLVVCAGDPALGVIPRGRPEGMRLDPDSVRLWDLRDLDRGPAILDVHAEPLEHADFSVDGAALLTHSRDAARLWDLRAGNPVGATITVEQAAEWRAALKAAQATRRARSVH